LCGALVDQTDATGQKFATRWFMSSSPTLPLAPIAATVLAMNASDRAKSYLCRVMEVTGFGGRRDGEAMLVSPDATCADGISMVGSLLGGGADSRIVAAIKGLTTSDRVPTRNSGTIRVPISDEAAVVAGLACGGTAEILLEPVEVVPIDFWKAVVARARIGLVSTVPSDGAAKIASLSGGEARCVVVTEGLATLLPAGVAEAVANQMRRGTVRAQIIEDEGLRWFCEVVSPLPHVGVVGVSELATAILRQAGLLGWTTTVTDERTETGLADCVALARSLGATDALVVLSHDLEASCGALHAAANESLGRPYLGALGSRHTQAARADRLRSIHGWSDDSVTSIHGPVGLDIGSRTPEETALAIVAEIVAYQRNRSASSLRAGQGSISAN
jgi:xanthine dehydrogenase accessory factor